MLVACLLLALQGAAPAAAAPRARGWDDFPVFVWREKHAGKPLPEELAEPFGGVLLMREEDSTWARERGLSYLIWNVAGRDALHLDADEAWNARVERWIETRDEALLVREPCLNDPATLERLFAALDRTIAKHGEHAGLGFVLGDEVSLTPNGDPFDLCRCGFCEAKWKEYAQEHGLPERAPLTDEVRLALLVDDYSLLGAWLARRRFDHDQLQALLRSLADRARGSGGTTVALLGLKGRTAFGGVDLLTAATYVDVLEGYALGSTPAVLETLSGPTPPDIRRTFDWSLGTLFVDGESPVGLAWLAWEQWLRGSDGLVLWDDDALERCTDTRRRLVTAIERIRDVNARFPWNADGAVPELGLVVDDDSIALGWLHDALLDGPTWPRRRQGYQERNGSRERLVSSWLDRADELGLTVEAVPLAKIRWARARALVLPQVVVVGADEIDALEKHLDRGGTLVLDGAFASSDHSGRPWPVSVADRLEHHAPERVHMAEDPLTKEVLAALRPEAKRWFTLVGAAAERPWLVRSFSSHVGDALEGVVLLPLAATAEERSRLADIPLDVRAECALEWLHPLEGKTLRAGDAAVFLLRPGEPAR